uniref:Uncharacterized protein n=1 Tax=Urocitellus parryii TaxID=9999 RepID=A0A8D2H151_UROPR
MEQKLISGSLPRMSIQSPPTLLELAGCSLLSNKSRAIQDLEDLPIELFPPLFVEAFSRGHTEVLKKMVQAWPFTCLPLGALMRKPQLEMLRVALDGLDMLLAHHTARLSQLSIELYPAPLESYDAQGAIHPARCSQICAELTVILKDFRHPKVPIFYTVPCPQCGHMFIYNQGLNHCFCPKAA